ncbi:NEW3 domain-containing protein, partial [Enterococcus thailandicus]
SRSEEETNVGDELLYVYTLTNNSSVASLKSGNLSIELPEGLEVVTRSEQNVSIDELAPGKTFTYQVKVKVTDAALNQNPVVKVTGKATNESSVEQDIPEASIEVPGGIVNEIDTSEINLTIPTKMNFGSDEEKIISPVYKMENNSTVPVEVSVEQFTPDTELKDKNLLLKIVADGQPVTLYENNQEINRAHLLLTLDAQEIKQVSFEGSVNKQTDVSKSSSNMRLRFKSTK